MADFDKESIYWGTRQNWEESTLKVSVLKKRNSRNINNSFKGTTKDSLEDLKNHLCSLTCIFGNPDYDALKRMANDKRVPILSLPTLLGWQRLTFTVGRQRQVKYVAPCMKILMSLDEIHAFLICTGCQIPINFFTFSVEINIRSIFVPKFNTVLIKDITGGREFLPITVINIEDSSTANLLSTEYIADYTFHQSVKKNDDINFLVCCECSDDCKDKFRCPCFQLTLQNCDPRTKSNIADNYDHLGYRNKLLGTHVLSGIYECNRMCRCHLTCTNRVAQLDIVFQLQLFKTMDKGWGVRTLHDIPKGSFMCKYVGQVITSQKASKIPDDGWKYLANIRVVQPFKDGYEEEIVQPKQKRIKFSRLAVHRKSKGSKIHKKYLRAENKKSRPENTLSKTFDNERCTKYLDSEVLDKTCGSKILKVGDKVINILSDNGIEYQEGFSWSELCYSKSVALSVEMKIPSKKGPPVSPDTPDSGISSPKEAIKSRNNQFLTENKATDEIVENNLISTDYLKNITFNKKVNGSVRRKYNLHSESLLSIKSHPVKFLKKKYRGRVSKVNSELCNNGENGVGACQFSNVPIKFQRSIINAKNDCNFQLSIPKFKNVDDEAAGTEQFNVFRSQDESTSLQPLNVLQMDTPKRCVVVRRRGKRQKILKTSGHLDEGAFENNTTTGEIIIRNSRKMNGRIDSRSLLQAKKFKSVKSAHRIGMRGSACAFKNVLAKFDQTDMVEVNESNNFKKALVCNKVVDSFEYKLRPTKVGKSLTSSYRRKNSALRIGKYMIDSKFEGNIGKYINHSCEPNLFPQLVFTEMQDLNFPVLALFACKDIIAGSELTWDYHYDLTDVKKCHQIKCHCNSKCCRGRLC